MRAIYVALVINPIIIGWVTKAMVTVLTETVLYDPEAVANAQSGASSANWGIIIGLLALVGVYCTLSGMWGVAMTDFVQFFAAMLGCVLLAVVAVQEVGGISSLQERLHALPNGENMLRFLPDGVTDLMVDNPAADAADQEADLCHCKQFGPCPPDVHIPPVFAFARRILSGIVAVAQTSALTRLSANTGPDTPRL